MFYTLTYLISPELKEREIGQLNKKIEGLIKKENRPLKSKIPRRITFSYPIEKKRGAFLATLEFKGEPEEIENFKKELQKEKNILRFLLIKKRKKVAN
ncbi:MAG: 30S ribosomal protein S6 [Patescibacteria group bacterium]|nr:30S ribosomal protein S6 [Patescibacteria group bacterium]